MQHIHIYYLDEQSQVFDILSKTNAKHILIDCFDLTPFACAFIADCLVEGKRSIYMLQENVSQITHAITHYQQQIKDIDCISQLLFH